MSLRWSSYVAPKSPKGGSKTQNGRFFSKIALRLKKVSYEVYFCKNCQRQSCRAFIGLTIHAKIIGGGVPSTWNFGSKWPRWGEIANFISTFARSASAVTSSENIQSSLIGSSLRAFHWAQDEPRTLSLPPPLPLAKSGSKTQSVQNLNNELRSLRNGTR